MAEDNLKLLNITGNEIQNLIRNYKKDSASRKNNAFYFKERINRLQGLLNDFTAINAKLNVEEVPKDHEYFTKNYYATICQVAMEYQEIFQKEIVMLEQTTTKTLSESITTQENLTLSSAQAEKTETIASSIAKQQNSVLISNQDRHSVHPMSNGIIRRFAAKMSTLERCLAGIAADSSGQTTQYWQIKRKTLEDIWQQLEELHDSIWEQFEDPISAGVDFRKYIHLEKEVQDRIVQASMSTIETNNISSSSTPNVLPLPKLVIPKFDGNYLKWSQFYDIFTHMVDKQPLPNVQKMYYLKSNITAEAERLISHFTVTEENYVSAWTLLQDRYNNKRLLTSSLIQKILNQPTENGTAGSIKALHDTTQECLLALENIGIKTNQWDPLLLQLLIKKLNRDTHMRYEQSISKPKEVQTIQEFLSFLEIHFQSLEALEPRAKAQMSVAKSLTSIATQSTKLFMCILCKNETHPLYMCKKFLSMNPSDRLKLVKDNKKTCVNCLKVGHMAAQCKSRNCSTCGKRHNTLLHLPNTASNNQSQTPKANEESTSTTVLTTAASNKGYVLLGTVQLNIVAANGKFVKCRAILDSGSQINLMTDRLAKQLNLDLHFAPIAIEGIGQRKKDCSNYVQAIVHSLHNGYSADIKAFVIPKIITHQPSLQLDISTWKIPSNLDLADPEFYTPGEIDILIGAGLYHHLLVDGRIELSNKLPILQNTIFGWMCCGQIDDLSGKASFCGVCSDDEDSLDSLITRFWKLDDFQQTSNKLSEAEKKCEDYFALTTKRNPEGRFIVRLPFNEERTSLGTSLQMATNRFYGLERRLTKNPEVQKQYIEFMREYERLGHMKKITEKALEKPCYVIPHHCVFKLDSTTTKLRVVFDASAKTSSGTSLNDITHTGPTVQSDLHSILLRFRTHRFVFTTDIEKMYRQIIMHPDDQKFQIIQWRENLQDKLQLYQLTTVTYGTRPAPYLATKCLQQLATDNKDILPLGASALKHDFYVDDGLSGSNSLIEALEIKRQLIQITASAGFKLRKWCANHAQLLEGIPPQDQEVNLDFDDETSHGAIKTLGLIWIPSSDELRIRTNQNFSDKITKRTVTSEMARIYDPLGLIAPVIMKAKIFIQGLWQMKIDWDTNIPNHQQQQWSKFRKELNMLNDLRIPRHVFKHKQTKAMDIHVFTDASEKGYGAAVYVRSENKDGTITVQLVCSKSRVAPLKLQTIPRLELCAALLGAELITKVKLELHWQNSATYMWTDSAIVLHWINSDAASFQTFVSHRIAKIQQLTLAEQWRHVRSKENPADIVSRGLNPSDIKNCTIWFHGPLFLHGHRNCWPSTFCKKLAGCAELEEKKSSTSTVLTTFSNDNLINLVHNFDHKGSIGYLQRVIGYALRFIKNMRIKREERCKDIMLSTTELNDAMTIILKAVQQNEFEDELKQLSENNQLKVNNAIASLTPFLDPVGLLRVGGRLNNAALPYDARHPILLPYNDPITTLIIRNLHENNFHCGPQALLAQVRQRFWPIKGKIMARSVVQHCVRCTRTQPKMFNQIMGNLPQDRVQRPFLNTGVDFCGPVWIHYKIRGKRPCKAYIAVFCCFATKAVHLEVVSDLTTEAFIGALNRFIHRRGRCQNLYCDNATNFVGARNQLQELKSSIYDNTATQRIHDSCSEKGINFEFIPPRAPHFGGLWEAAVKSAKHLLTKGIGNASLTYEELETVIVQIEGILNSRPITPMSSDPNDLAALTPGHFLIGEPITAYPTENTKNEKMSTLQRWKLVKHLKENFWSRWSNEYLNELQHRRKWKIQASNVELGTMVIVKEDNAPPLHWPLGRITKTFKGDDGMVRVVEVKTSSGLIKRAIHRLAPLFPEDSMQPPIKINQSAKNKGLDRQLTPEERHLPNKKSRLSNNTFLLTIIAFILCLPMALCTSVHITNYSNKPGMHFENIGKNYVVSSYWNLLIYYDLEPLRTELAVLKKGTSILQQTCLHLKNDLCNELIPQFSQATNELESDVRLFLPKRTKRGAMNIVGNIANSLFGVLDSEYAEEMSRSITELHGNQQFLLDLIKNQTSIIDSTLNIIKTNEQTAKVKFDSLDKSIAELKEYVVATNNIKQQQGIIQSVLSLAVHLIITTTNLQKTQALILNVLTDVHHGQVGPLLLSPEQLTLEISKIKSHLPSSVRFPVQQDDLLGIYKLMTVESGLTQGHVLFKISIPLVGNQNYNIYKVYAIPVTNNGEMIAIQPSTEFISITAHGDSYFPMTQQQISACLVLKNQIYLCPLLHAIYTRGSTQNSCEANFYNNETTLACHVTELVNDQWIQIGDKNEWIFAVKHPIKITAVCGSETIQNTIEGSGILKIKPDCIVKNERFTLLGHQVFSSSFTPSITSHNNWSHLHDPKTTEPILLENAILPYHTEIKELMVLQKALKNQQILQLPNDAKKTNYHIFGISYLSMTIIIITALYVGIKKYRKRRQEVHITEPKNIQPTPTPRAHDFTVKI